MKTHINTAWCQLALFAALFCICRNAAATTPHHFIFFGMDRQRIHDSAFLQTAVVDGAQLKYTWRELEPARDHYDFSSIRKDRDFLNSKHKKLFLQLQDVTFDPISKCVPQYLLNDKQFHGGADKQYNIENNDEAHATVQGWVARRWDSAVRGRFQKLLTALGKEFDGSIEGLNLPETALDFGETGGLYPKGFTPAIYRDAIIADMAALKRAFPKSVTMQYANFMPGEWLPDDNKHYLSSVYDAAKKLKVGVGGPDLFPYRPSQMNHSYPLIRASHGVTPTGIAVQEGDYGAIIVKTKKAATIAELVEFASDYLKVDYIFWCTEEPYYTKKLIPFLKGQTPHSKVRPK